MIVRFQMRNQINKRGRKPKKRSEARNFTPENKLEKDQNMSTFSPNFKDKIAKNIRNHNKSISSLKGNTRNTVISIEEEKFSKKDIKSRKVHPFREPVKITAQCSTPSNISKFKFLNFIVSKKPNISHEMISDSIHK